MCYCVRWEEVRLRGARVEHAHVPGRCWAHWYGGAEMTQHWPIRLTPAEPQPFVTSDAPPSDAAFGGILERYWLASPRRPPSRSMTRCPSTWAGTDVSAPCDCRRATTTRPTSRQLAEPLHLSSAGLCVGLGRHPSKHGAALFLLKPSRVPAPEAFRGTPSGPHGCCTGARWTRTRCRPTDPSAPLQQQPPGNRRPYTPAYGDFDFGRASSPTRQ